MIDKLIMFLVGGGVATVCTLVSVGENLPYETYSPPVKGNVACWFDAGGLQLTAVSGEKKFHFPIPGGSREQTTVSRSR